jgi:hypothetical protein
MHIFPRFVDIFLQIRKYSTFIYEVIDSKNTVNSKKTYLILNDKFAMKKIVYLLIVNDLYAIYKVLLKTWQLSNFFYRGYLHH